MLGAALHSKRHLKVGARLERRSPGGRGQVDQGPPLALRATTSAIDRRENAVLLRFERWRQGGRHNIRRRSNAKRKAGRRARNAVVYFVRDEQFAAAEKPRARMVIGRDPSRGGKNACTGLQVEKQTVRERIWLVTAWIKGRWASVAITCSSVGGDICSFEVSSCCRDTGREPDGEREKLDGSVVEGRTCRCVEARALALSQKAHGDAPEVRPAAWRHRSAAGNHRRCSFAIWPLAFGRPLSEGAFGAR